MPKAKKTKVKSVKEKQEAEEILSQAQTHSGLSVSDFVATQKYRDLGRIQDLEMSLMSI